MSSDGELVERVCQRDELAFEALLDRYRASVYRYVYAMLHDSSATEDVVQETFLRLWTHAVQWHGQGSFQSWLFRVATNLALNQLRALSRRRQQALETVIDPLDEDDESSIPSWMVDHSLPTPELVVEQDERYRLLQQLVAELPAEKQTVFRLIYEDDMAIRQTAQTLGIPEGTVKSRLHYATRRLARAWRELQHEWEDLA